MNKHNLGVMWIGLGVWFAAGGVALILWPDKVKK
jgi:hypothetical protein